MPALRPVKARNGSGRETEVEASFPAGDPCPDFLCVGAQKGGTSWLYRQLEAHSDFWMPPVKELHYLDQLNRTKRFHAPRCRDQCDSFCLEGMNGLSGRSYLDLESYGRLFQHKAARVSGDSHGYAGRGFRARGGIRGRAGRHGGQVGREDPARREGGGEL